MKAPLPLLYQKPVFSQDPQSDMCAQSGLQALCQAQASSERRPRAADETTQTTADSWKAPLSGRQLRPELLEES